MTVTEITVLTLRLRTGMWAFIEYEEFADLGGCYPPRPSASVDNTLLDLQNSSYPTQPHSIISKYIFDFFSQHRGIQSILNQDSIGSADANFCTIGVTQYCFFFPTETSKFRFALINYLFFEGN